MILATLVVAVALPELKSNLSSKEPPLLDNRANRNGHPAINRMAISF